MATSGDAEYGGIDNHPAFAHGSTGPVAPPVPSGTLPHTGVDVGLIVIGGVMIFIIGVMAWLSGKF